MLRYAQHDGMERRVLFLPTHLGATRRAGGSTTSKIIAFRSATSEREEHRIAARTLAFLMPIADPGAVGARNDGGGKAWGVYPLPLVRLDSRLRGNDGKKGTAPSRHARESGHPVAPVTTVTPTASARLSLLVGAPSRRAAS